MRDFELKADDKDGCSFKFGGCGGCLTLVVVVIAFWAMLFGFTWKGHHYGMSCSRANGVKVE